MSQDSIEKIYYESLMVGHYIDVRYSDQEWKIAKIVDREKRYAVIVFDATNSKEEQVLLQSYKTAPLRMFTEGYTGHVFRANRINSTPIAQYKTHLEILNQTYIKDANLPSAFTITQYLRGQLFVMVHSLLCRDDFKEEEASQAMKFLIGFIDFVVKLADKIKKIAPQYFEANTTNKYQYLVNQKIALVNSLSELVYLLNLILRVQTSRVANFHKCKLINTDMLKKFFVDLAKVQIFVDLFNINDGNAKWLSFSIHKRLYFLLKNISPKFALPNYKLKDYQQVLQIYSFVMKEQQKDNNIENAFLSFIIDLLKEQSTFEAKLKALQQLKKIVEDETKFYHVDKKAVFSQLHSKQLLEHMTSQFNFNGEIFKRFIPILAQYCKYKPIPQKSINQLFKISNNRHESEVVIIQEIICSLCQFIQVDSLDSIYTQILKNPLNNQQTMKFIKNFTINAISNFSQQKSFLSSFFKKSKNSGKYGFYGLDLFFKEIQEEGSLNKQNSLLAFDMIKQIFTQKDFQSERFRYILICIGWIQKSRNYGQSIKIIDNIISTYPSTTYFEDSKKQILDRLISKHNFLQKLLQGIKGKVSQVKFTMAEIIKWIYEFLDGYYDFLLGHIKIKHIQFLWSLEQKKLLSDFLRKSKGTEGRKKYIKKIDEAVQEEILNKLVKNKNLFDRQLIFEEFEALNQIFISHNYLKKKIQLSQRGFIRYITPEMEGYGFYFDFVEKMNKNANIIKVVKKTINVFLRPKDEKDIETKISTWKMCLLKLVDRLKANPQVCLNAIQVFFQMIQGVAVRQGITTPQGNIEVIVSNDSQQRTIILPKTSTIWRLRRQIMIDFNINGDFGLYSNNMRREITFAEEQEFSMNALPLQSKGPSIAVIGRKKEKHIQIIAYQKFKEMIEKQEMFYDQLFNLNNQQNQELFWKTVDLLPVNRILVRKIENCQNFKKKNWQNILKSSAKQSLQYHLNIISDLMEKNKKWVSLFYSTDGLTVILQCLQVEKFQALGQRITNRCLTILIKILDIVDKIQQNLVEETYLTLIAKLIHAFKEQQMDKIKISLETINLIFSILNKLGKIFKPEKLDINVILKILTFGIFKPKSKHATNFIQADFESYLINNYNEPTEKQKVFEHILDLLNVQSLKLQQHSEMLFLFFIDYMNTFVNEEQMFVNREDHLFKIRKFVVQCLQSNFSDVSKNKFHPLLFGSFKLFIYTLNCDENLYDLKTLFNNLLNEFLFNKKQKRAKHQTTIKIVYESLKKILFLRPTLIHSLCSQVAPQLIKSPWRKNSIYAWSIESKRQQRSVYCGLQNLGATCYINCLIQQLFHIQHFRQNFLSIRSQQYKPLQENQIYQLQYIFQSLKHSNKKSLSTKKFCDSFVTYEGVPINPMVQSDADQFFNTLMQKIQTFLKAYQRHDIIENTFEGKLSNQLNCEGCPHQSEKLDNFLSIGVNIRGKKCLEEALDGYVEGEILDGDNAYFCELCQKKVRTLKRLCIKQLPNILTIVLKRFQFNFDEMRKIKINSYLKFPEVLNMQKYTADYLAGDHSQPEAEFTYALRGTVIHSGTSQGGHYYSFVKSNDKWYSFNDEFIDQINAKKIQQQGYGGQDKASQTEFKFEKFKNAYILFYEKVKTSSEYHKNEPEILNDYTQNIKNEIITENNNAEFLSVILDDHFVRLAQNISCLQNPESFKFTMLYFHTVVLRDKNKDEHIPNYFRIICNHLKSQQKSEWYLKQMNHRFFKEFVIEAPRIVRHICASLVIQAIKHAKNVPINIFRHGIFCLSKKGMQPFAKIFKELSKNQAYLERLIKMNYPERVVNIILDQAPINFSLNQIELFDSYFGTDSSQKEKDREICNSSLCESLQNFKVPFADLVQIFNKNFSRSGSKVIASKISKEITEEQVDVMLNTLQGEIIKQGELKKEDIQKYMFFVRAVCISADENTLWKINKCIESLKRMLNEAKNYYDPMDTIIRQINYIGCKNKLFFKRLKENMQEKQSIDLVKSLKCWLKDADRPLIFEKSNDFRRRTAGLNLQDKTRFELINKFQLQKRMNWMIEKQVNQQVEINSDLEDTEQKELTIRNKKFKIKQHLGLLKRVQIEGQEKWGLLEKNQFDVIVSL